MDNAFLWYQSLAKPLWAPPSWIFGPVWTFLYVIITITFGFVFYKAFKKQLPWIVALPFLLNLVFNFAFTPIQFGLQNNLLAAVDIILVLATLVWAMAVIYPKIRWVFWLNIPYVLWVCFATILQITITYLNMDSTPYILIALVTFGILALLALAMLFRMRKQHKPLSKLGAISLGLVIAGIVFSENRMLGYSLIGAGVILAVTDIFIKSKNKTR